MKVSYTFEFDAEESANADGTCTCGAALRGTAEVTTATAYATFADGKATFDGETESDWDNQTSVVAENGLPLLVCASGHYYLNPAITEVA